MLPQDLIRSKQKAGINFVMWIIKHIVWVLIEQFKQEVVAKSILRSETEAHEAQAINCQPTKSSRTNWIFRISLQDLSVVKLNSKLNASFAFLNTNKTEAEPENCGRQKKNEKRKNLLWQSSICFIYFRVTSIDFERLLCTLTRSGWLQD